MYGHGRNTIDAAHRIDMARKNLSTRIENDLQKEVKKLAIDLERPLNDLLEEAIEDLLTKYEKNRTSTK